jgi:uncharacterized membrane protein YvlD (DUF360 family)
MEINATWEKVTEKIHKIRWLRLMTEKQEGAFAVAAAILVMFTAMVDPIVSIIFSVLLFTVYGVFKIKSGKK